MERTAWLGGNDNITGFIHFNHWLKLKRNMRRLWTGNNSIGMKILIRHKRKEEEITLVSRNVSITVTVTLVSRRKRSGQSPVCSIGVMFSWLQSDVRPNTPGTGSLDSNCRPSARLCTHQSGSGVRAGRTIACRYFWNWNSHRSDLSSDEWTLSYNYRIRILWSLNHILANAKFGE